MFLSIISIFLAYHHIVLLSYFGREREGEREKSVKFSRLTHLLIKPVDWIVQIETANN